MDPGFGQGAISYFIAGTAPNRIVQLQIENAAFIYDQTFSDYFDTQLWFYETTNVIEIHNGPRSVLNINSWYPSYAGPTIALLRDTSTFIHLYGPASNAMSSTSFVADYVTGAPPEDKVYRFSPIANGIANIDQLPVSVFPNPSTGFFSIESPIPIDGYSLYNMHGQLICERVTNNTYSTSIDLSSHSNGIYIIRLYSNTNTSTHKIILSYLFL